MASYRMIGLWGLSYFYHIHWILYDVENIFQDAEEFTFAEQIDLSREFMPIRKLLWLFPDKKKIFYLAVAQIEVDEFREW